MSDSRRDDKIDNLDGYAKRLFKEEKDVQVRETAGALWLSWEVCHVRFDGTKRRASYPIGTVDMPVRYLKQQIRELASSIV